MLYGECSVTERMLTDWFMGGLCRCHELQVTERLWGCYSTVTYRIWTDCVIWGMLQHYDLRDVTKSCG